ncbi:MAG: TetR/AcrR family transcriptional regulator [Terriglobia bacterium]
MSSRTRTHKQGLHKDARAAILRAAERIFAEKGLDGARTDAIARAAGVNKALLYYYFESKDALFLAAFEEVMRESHLKLMAILCGGGSEKEILLSYAEALFDGLSQRPDSYLLFQRFIMENPKLVERLVKKFFLPRFRKVTAVIRRGVRRGELRPVDCNQASLSIGALIVFYFSCSPIMKTVARFDPFNPNILKKRKREMIEFIRYGLFKNPEARTR